MLPVSIAWVSFFMWKKCHHATIRWCTSLVKKPWQSCGAEYLFPAWGGIRAWPKNQKSLSWGNWGRIQQKIQTHFEFQMCGFQSISNFEIQNGYEFFILKPPPPKKIPFVVWRIFNIDIFETLKKHKHTHNTHRKHAHIHHQSTMSGRLFFNNNNHTYNNNQIWQQQ